MCLVSISRFPSKRVKPDLLTDPLFQPPSSRQHTEPHFQSPTASPSPSPSAPSPTHYPVRSETSKSVPPGLSTTGLPSGSQNTKCWTGRGEKATLLHYWREYKLVQQLGRTVRRFLQEAKRKLPADPSSLFWANTQRRP